MEKFTDSNVNKHELNMMSYRANSSTAEATLWKSVSAIQPTLFLTYVRYLTYGLLRPPAYLG